MHIYDFRVDYVCKSSCLDRFYLNFDRRRKLDVSDF